jgi:hypothetical protein
MPRTAFIEEFNMAHVKHINDPTRDKKDAPKKPEQEKKDADSKK